MARSSVFEGGVDDALSGSNSMSLPGLSPLAGPGPANAVPTVTATASAARDTCLSRRIKLLRCHAHVRASACEIIDVLSPCVKPTAGSRTREVALGCNDGSRRASALIAHGSR